MIPSVFRIPIRKFPSIPLLHIPGNGGIVIIAADRVMVRVLDVAVTIVGRARLTISAFPRRRCECIA